MCHNLLSAWGILGTPLQYIINTCRDAVGSHSSYSEDLVEKWLEHLQQRVVTMGNCFFSQQKNTNVRVSLPAVCFVWEIAMVVLFGIFIRYDPEADAHWEDYRKAHNITSDIENDFYYRYPSKYNSVCKRAYIFKCMCFWKELIDSQGFWY